MTITQAADRARAIWGEQRFFSVRMRPDGGAEITLLRTFLRDEGAGAGAGESAGYSAHRLDCLGMPICHRDCEQLAHAQP